MKIEIADFNGANLLLSRALASQWENIREVLEKMPLHLKASDQAGIQGNAIFDPVGTNEYIKRELTKKPHWSANVPIPEKYAFLGTDVDFVCDGLLVEAQFSNYPFLLNNLIRSELFFKAHTKLGPRSVQAVVIVTKAHIFPASNSTLYYEQAQRQLSALAEERVYDVPIRLVGLFEESGKTIEAIWSEYHNSRYSRTVVSRTVHKFALLQPKSARSRCTIRKAGSVTN